jgi:hypothetical protein
MRGLIARRFTAPEELDPSDGRRCGNYPRLHGDSLRANLRLAELIRPHGSLAKRPPAARLAELEQRDG